MSPRAATATGFAGFPPEALGFLRDLAANNAKPWFEAHRATYEGALRAPMLALVEEMDARLGRIAPELVGDRRRSMFRIHRDVRFSKDKSPYKTNAACWFFHRDVRGGGTADASESTGAAVHGGAGFYFHLAPGDCFAGGGLWMPPRPALGEIREKLATRHAEWEAIVRAPAFRRRFGALDEEAMLTRVPRGWKSASRRCCRWCAGSTTRWGCGRRSGADGASLTAPR